MSDENTRPALHLMYARWTGHCLVSGDVSWCASLVRTLPRDAPGAAPKQQHIGMLGRISESQLRDQRRRRLFWLTVEQNLEPHRPTQVERAVIMQTLRKRVPR
jgi:hypothetical protein